MAAGLLGSRPSLADDPLCFLLRRAQCGRGHLRRGLGKRTSAVGGGRVHVAREHSSLYLTITTLRRWRQHLAVSGVVTERSRARRTPSPGPPRCVAAGHRSPRTPTDTPCAYPAGAAPCRRTPVSLRRFRRTNSCHRRRRGSGECDRAPSWRSHWARAAESAAPPSRAGATERASPPSCAGGAARGAPP